jgi:hypothetical protein
MAFGAGSLVPVRYFDRNGAVDDAWQGDALVTWEPEVASTPTPTGSP